jgi:hypothetical protein
MVAAVTAVETGPVIAPTSDRNLLSYTLVALATYSTSLSRIRKVRARK